AKIRSTCSRSNWRFANVGVAGRSLAPRFGETNAMTNPLDLTGSEFLGLYVFLLPLALLLTWILRRDLRLPGDLPYPGDDALDPYQAAYLAGGGNRAVDTAIARLVQGHVLGVKDDLGAMKLTLEGPPPTKAYPLEQAIHVAVNQELSARPEAVRREVRPAVDAIRDRLAG